MDEARLGTDPNNPDTDGDGLTDLAEYSLTTFGQTDPRKSDSDGDGIEDGKDPLPHYTSPPELKARSGAIEIDGTIEEESWRLLSENVRSASTPQYTSLPAGLYATWDEENLYIAVRARVQFGLVDIQVDGSGTNGPWIGGDYFNLRADMPAGRFYSQHGDPSKFEPNHVDTWNPARIAPEAVPGAEVAATTVDGWTSIEIRIPRELGYGFGLEQIHEKKPLVRGLTLEPDRVIGMNILLSRLNAAPNVNVDSVLALPMVGLTDIVEFLDLVLTR